MIICNVILFAIIVRDSCKRMSTIFEICFYPMMMVGGSFHFYLMIAAHINGSAFLV